MCPLHAVMAGELSWFTRARGNHNSRLLSLFCTVCNVKIFKKHQVKGLLINFSWACYFYFASL